MIVKTKCLTQKNSRQTTVTGFTEFVEQTQKSQTRNFGARNVLHQKQKRTKSQTRAGRTNRMKNNTKLKNEKKVR